MPGRERISGAGQVQKGAFGLDYHNYVLPKGAVFGEGLSGWNLHSLNEAKRDLYARTYNEDEFFYKLDDKETETITLTKEGRVDNNPLPEQSSKIAHRISDAAPSMPSYDPRKISSIENAYYFQNAVRSAILRESRKRGKTPKDLLNLMRSNPDEKVFGSDGRKLSYEVVNGTIEFTGYGSVDSDGHWHTNTDMPSRVLPDGSMQWHRNGKLFKTEAGRKWE